MIWYLSLNDNQLAIAGENFVYNASLLDAEVRLMENTNQKNSRNITPRNSTNFITST